uniref:Putative ixostatin n=1 Tax=Ixodes ricinus TaxID=34613 RepID=A0A0K8RCD9_IXORI
MYKISLILLLTSPLVFNVTGSRAQTFSPQTSRKLSLFWSDSDLGSELDKLCANHGAQKVKSVDFTNCKMECWATFANSLASRTYPLPYGTPCGLYNKKCQPDGCWGPRGTS